MRVGILGMKNRPAVYYVARKMLELKTPPVVIFQDPSPTSQKDIDIWKQRTAGRIPDHDPEALGITIVSNCGHRDQAFPALVAEYRIDLLISAATPGILKAHTLNACPKGILNVHPGHLPDYRGCTCVEWAIYNDDAVGNSVHLMTQGIDEGPLVAVEDYSFTKKDRYVDIRVKTLNRGYELLARTASNFIKTGTMTSQPQEEGTYYKPIPDQKLAQVIAKLVSEGYKFQL
jgi:methionyl-tRNA formyltransferase